MKSLVVVAPSSNRRHHELVQRAAGTASAALESRGHDVTLFDLVDFRPAMSTSERRAYETDEPLIDEVTRTHAAHVTASTALVFVYGTTLSSVPPELKGWFDRVLVPGVSFFLDDSNRARRGLRHVDHLVGVAVYDDTWWECRRGRDPGRRIILRALRSCGRLSMRCSWVPLYSAARADESEVEKWICRVEQRMGKL
jgi:putative NADPH-quinone reductase